MLAAGILKYIRSAFAPRPILQRVVFAALAGLWLALEISCSGPYLRNRWQDSKDVFTATIESESYGGALRLGPVKAGVNYKAPGGSATGLRGGQTGEHYSADFAAFFFGADYFSDAPIRFDSWKPDPEPDSDDEDSDDADSDEPDATQDLEASAGDDSASSDATRGNSKGARRDLRPATDTPAKVEEEETVSPADYEEPLLRLRNKIFRAFSPLGTEQPAHKSQSLLKDDDTDWAPGYYFTQAELQLGLYMGIRLGWNAGETFDWLVGWAGFDPMNDDAPYADSIEEQLEQYPYWNLLSEEEKDAIRERLREGSGSGAGNLLLGP